MADYGDGRIQKFDSAGNFIFLWNIGSDKYVSSLTVDRADNVYLVYKGEVWKYRGLDGQLIGQVELPDDSRIDEVTATADGGLIAASNTGAYWQFDSAGRIVFSLSDNRAIDSSDTEGVDAMAVDGVGNIFILGDSTHTIYKYSNEGQLLAHFGSSGDEQGQFRAPLDMAVDGQGRLFVSDIKGIQVFAPDGRYLDHFPIDGVAYGLAFSDQGELWTATSKSKLVKYVIEK